MDAFMGTILLWSCSYAPRGWAFCNGQTLQISQNQALFALLGTTYGGDGRSTFCLPDLRGKIAIGGGNMGQVPGRPYLQLGANAPMGAAAVAGAAATGDKMPTYMGLNFIIALEGIFPSRN